MAVNVLVTGGAGFIGTHLVSRLIEGDHRVTVLDNLHRAARLGLTDARRSRSVRFIHGDTRDPATVHTALRGAQRVYHLAAQSNVLGAVADIDYSFTTNVVGTYNLLIAARDEGVERVVFTSSREAYGEVDTIPVHEDTPLVPKNAYGASKVAGEVYCRTFQNTYGLDVSVLRLANVYGRGDRDRVIPIWFDRAMHGQELELYGGGQVFDFVPVELVVSALLRAAESSLGGCPINVGSGVGVTLHDLTARVQSLAAGQGGVRVLPARTVEVTRFVADTHRMRDILGVEPPQDPLTDLNNVWESIRLLAA